MVMMIIMDPMHASHASHRSIFYLPWGEKKIITVSCIRFAPNSIHPTSARSIHPDSRIRIKPLELSPGIVIRSHYSGFASCSNYWLVLFQKHFAFFGTVVCFFRRFPSKCVFKYGILDEMRFISTCRSIDRSQGGKRRICMYVYIGELEKIHGSPVGAPSLIHTVVLSMRRIVRSDRNTRRTDWSIHRLHQMRKYPFWSFNDRKF